MLDPGSLQGAATGAVAASAARTIAASISTPATAAVVAGDRRGVAGGFERGRAAARHDVVRVHVDLLERDAIEAADHVGQERILDDHGAAALQQFGEDVLPLVLLFAISVSGLLLTASYTWMRGYAYDFLAILHAVTVIVTLLYLPFGKLFHILQRPAQLGVSFYKEAGARGEQARCRRCQQPFASRAMIHDLTRVPSRALVSIYTLCIAVCLSIVIASCGDDESPTDGGDGTFNGTIRVLDNAFSPRSVTISVGDSVTWSWQGSNQHTVTHGTPGNPGGLFDNGPKSSGTFGYRFTSAGSVPYFCEVHGSAMTATITVQP